MTNIKNFDLNLLRIKDYLKKITDCVIYDIKYFKNLDNKNSLYLVFNNVDLYIEENNEDKYLIFVLTDKNKKALKKYTELWDETKDQIELISGNKPIGFKIDFMKIKFESDDNSSLGKILNIPVCVIVARSVFQENNNYYPQVFLHEYEYEYEYDCTFFDNKSKGSGIKNEIKQNQQLANELHKPIIRKFKKRKVYSSLKTIFGCLFS